MQAMKSGMTIRVGKHIYEGRVEYIGMGLGELICDAYGIRPKQVVGLSRSYTGRFDIIATLPANSRKEDLDLMLQDLLADRFKLIAHQEMQEQRALALVVGKDGARLTMTAPERLQARADALGEGVTASVGSKPNSPYTFTSRAGSNVIRYSIMEPSTFNPRVHVEAYGLAMAGLADLLTQWRTGNAGLVVDATGLDGSFDVSLDIRMSDMGSTPQPANTSGLGEATTPPAPAESVPEVGGETLVRSLRTLGLDLVDRRLSVGVLIIDHLERTPTEN
jgi:uncharacterized protein (TIGR03435 family)